MLYIGSQMSKVTGSGAGNWEILGKKKKKNEVDWMYDVE